MRLSVFTFLVFCCSAAVGQVPVVFSLSPSSGSTLGGTVVTITGTNLVVPATVSLPPNFIAATSATGGTSMVFTTGPGMTGSFNTIVYTAGGASAVTGGDVFQYTGGSVGQPPVVSQVLPGYGSVAGATAVTITGVGFSPSSSVTFGGVPAMVTTYVSTSSLVAYSPPLLSGTTSVVVTTGTSSSSGGMRSTFLVSGSPCVATVYYFGSTGTNGVDDRQNALVSLINSATSSVMVSSWDLSNGSIGMALSMAASRGVSVSVVQDYSNRSGSSPAVAKAMVASGVHVFTSPVPKTITNNFVTVDGSSAASGNYYASGSSVQAGSYVVVTNCPTVSANDAAEFAALINGGHVYTPP
jgi:hypothetical protein